MSDFESPESYTQGLRRQFIESNNPLYAWIAIKSCIKSGDALPRWVNQYLDACADRMLDGKASKGDIRAALPSIIGFKQKRGAAPQLSKGFRDLADEQLAVAFAVAIMRGKKPANARADALLESSLDDRTMQRLLRRFFTLRRLPITAEEWRLIVIRWMIANPSARERYPSLPLITPQLALELASVSRKPDVSS